VPTATIREHDLRARPEEKQAALLERGGEIDNPAWIDGVRSGAYREWVEKDYGTR